MAKNLATLALLLCIAALFVPLRQASMLGITVTEGAFAGEFKNVALGLMMTGPAALAALFGATVGRKGFARGLGVLHFLFGAASLGMCGLAASTEHTTMLTGGFLACGGAALVFIAGLIGLVKPERN